MRHDGLMWAEILDSYRVWPRGLIVLYAVMVYRVTAWFMGLEDPNTAQAILISTVWGASAAWFGVYVNSGRKWGEMQTWPMPQDASDRRHRPMMGDRHENW